MSESRSQVKPFGIPKQMVWEAYLRVKANKGAAGVDDQSIAEFEAGRDPMPWALGRSGTEPQRVLTTLSDIPWLTVCCACSRRGGRGSC